MSSILFTKQLPLGNFEIYRSKPNFQIALVKQVHGTNLIKITDSHSFDTKIPADGMYGNNICKIPFCILTADCLPIVIIGKKKHALIHAGWRGLSQEILHQKIIDEIKPYYFFVGPHIHSCCYEVQKDFTQHFSHSSAFINRNNKIYFDLASILKNQIEQKYRNQKIEFSSICTCCNKNFHSYRRNKTKLRNWNIYLGSNMEKLE